MNFMFFAGKPVNVSLPYQTKANVLQCVTLDNRESDSLLVSKTVMTKRRVIEYSDYL